MEMKNQSWLSVSLEWPEPAMAHRASHEESGPENGKCRTGWRPDKDRADMRPRTAGQQTGYYIKETLKCAVGVGNSVLRRPAWREWVCEQSWQYSFTVGAATNETAGSRRTSHCVGHLVCCQREAQVQVHRRAQNATPGLGDNSLRHDNPHDSHCGAAFERHRHRAHAGPSAQPHPVQGRLDRV